MTTFNTMQQIKRQFFAMRNGALADNMRRAGASYRIIFGLNLPQIVEISRDFTPDADLALSLWNNTTTRESMLLAPMLFPREELTNEIALQWIDSAVSPECVDILCHRLLRHLPDAAQLIPKLAQSDSDIKHYAAIRLAFNLLPGHTDISEPIARNELRRGCPMTSGVSRMLLEEIEYLKEE